MIELAAIREWAGLVLLTAGVGFLALGVFGLFRMPDCYTRMHACSKAVTLGAPMSLVGVALLAPLPIALRALAVTAFIFLTSPVSIFVTARAAHRRREPLASETVIDELEELRRSERASDRAPYPLD